MTSNTFFPKPAPLELGALASAIGATLANEEQSGWVVHGVAPLEAAQPGDLAFLENTAYARHAAITGATACILAPRFAANLPETCAGLISKEPYRAFARAAAMLFPTAARPQSIMGLAGISSGAFIHPDARLEPGVIIDPGVVVGPGAEIGQGTILCAQAVIGPGVKIGRDCAVGAGATITHAFLGNRVIVHAGVRIGQDGFGFAMGPGGHIKVPQVGRVIIQDGVEIGANSAIDRGANRDTVVGEGTKIDNLVQIGHNVTIGRHCVICGQVGIAGSSVLEDYAVLGGQVGLAGHLKIGMGAQIAAQSGVMGDVAAGTKMMGSPAKPARQHLREVAALGRLTRRDDAGS